MSVLYFDTETTSLIPGQICQLSYIIDHGSHLAAKNYYFTVDEMDPGAYRVHKLSRRSLEELSGGRRFKDSAEEIHADFAESDLLSAHNFRFDYAFMSREFERIDMRFRYNDDFCTMRHFVPHCKLGGTNRGTYKFPKLSELSAHFGIEEDALSEAVRDIFGGALGLHDARYDTTLMYLCVKEALKNPGDTRLLNKFTAPRGNYSKQRQDA